MQRGTMPRRYAPGVSIRCTNYPYMPLHTRHTTAVIHEREPRVCVSGVVVSLWPLTTLCSKVFLIMDSCCLLTGGSSWRCSSSSLAASGYSRVRALISFEHSGMEELGRKRLTCKKIAASRIDEFNRPGLMIAEAVAVDGARWELEEYLWLLVYLRICRSIDRGKWKDERKFNLKWTIGVISYRERCEMVEISKQIYFGTSCGDNTVDLIVVGEWAVDRSAACSETVCVP